MRSSIHILCALLLAARLCADVITAVEYSWDVPAPPGTGTPVNIVPGNQINVSRNVSIASLPQGLHRLYLRAHDDSSGWGGAHSLWVYRLPPALHVDSTITAFEFWFDNGPHTAFEVGGGAEVQWIGNVPLNSLPQGFHRLYVRARNAAGMWGAPESEVVFVFAPALVTQHVVTAFEAWVDNGTHFSYDVADASEVQLIRNLPVAELTPGMHKLFVRCLDQGGNWSGAQSQFFMVFPRVDTNPGRIAGAEFWINVDPGQGNGLPLAPTDGGWDEFQEEAFVYVQDIPPGFHRIGVRVRDDVGHWSGVEIDTFTVGPMLVISTSGNDVILHWSELPGITDFEVWRSSQIDGGFNLIGSVSANAYTDPGIIASQPQLYYHVKWVPNARAQSAFRLPDTGPSSH
ncbi:MAG: hypothetical protein IPG71_04265 [bacterium]|nr:hypothetical protein [bacterium]